MYRRGQYSVLLEQALVGPDAEQHVGYLTSVVPVEGNVGSLWRVDVASDFHDAVFWLFVFWEGLVLLVKMRVAPAHAGHGGRGGDDVDNPSCPFRASLGRSEQLGHNQTRSSQCPMWFVPQCISIPSLVSERSWSPMTLALLMSSLMIFTSDQARISAAALRTDCWLDRSI